MTGNSALSFEVKLFRDLDEVARDAEGALDRGARASLFERLDWFRLLETHCPPPGDLLVIRARQGDRRAWLFLKVDDRRAVGLTSWYSFEFGAIIERAGPPQGDLLVDGLVAGLRGTRIVALDLSPLAPDDPLGRGLAGKAWLHRLAPATMRWSINTSGSDFAAYWASRPSRLRNTAERKAKGAGLDIRIHTRFEPEAWAAYERVYAASWKPAEGSPALLRALAEQEGAAGTLRLGLAYRDGEPVAAQFWLVEGGLASIHKLAHVESARAFSPGTLLGREMFRHVLDVDRVNRIDFGLGDDPYKAEWVDQRRVMNRLVAYDLRSPLGAWRAARAAAGALVRRLRND